MSVHSKVILDNARDFGLLTLPGKVVRGEGVSDH